MTRLELCHHTPSSKCHYTQPAECHYTGDRQCQHAKGVDEMARVNKDQWRRQVQISMSPAALEGLDKLAKLDREEAGYGKPNRSGTIDRLIREEYLRKTGNKLRWR
jgi:hypothetical protein